jgi:RNA 2',3'-cyclic 3'-phosphodiesterase
VPQAPEHARLFLALELPGVEREALAGWRDRAIAGRDDLRAVDARALHLTIVFLGRRPELEIPSIADCSLAAVAGLAPAVLEPTAVVGVPRRRPRLFALDLADRGRRAAAVQAAASGALASAGFYTPEKRPFWPHLTLARVRGAGRRGREPTPKVDPLEVDRPSGSFTCDRVTLYRSHLSPSGARYEPLNSARLRS